MKNYICVYDFETDSPKPETCEPVQIAALMLHPHTLNIVEDSEFVSYMRPEGIDDKNYLKKNYDTIKWHATNYHPDFYELKSGDQDEAVMGILQKWKDAPNQKQVWSDFCTYLLKYNNNQARRSKFSAPIRAGANIRRFDNTIVDRMCTRFGTVTKDGEQKIFQPRDVVDIMELAFYWFENLPEPKAYNMGALREFFGMSDEGAHDALVDIRDEAAMIQKFLRLHRSIAAKVKFRGAMIPRLSS